jgi:hypothetical protein
MIYKLLPLNFEGIQILARIDDNGKCRLTCTEHDPEYLKWIEEGNVPTPADE